MEKKCIVIMPINDQDGYAQGHFNRVYEYIIVPACRQAGFRPIRADDSITTNESAWDLTKNIIESDIAICDLSSKNQNVLYGFSIRQVFNLPVTLIKDLKTQNSDIHEFDVVEYDESLRIDTVQKATETLSESLKNTFANKGEVNSLLSRLGIGSGQSTDSNTAADRGQEFISAEETEITAPKEAPLPTISPLPDYVGDPFTQQDIDKAKVGDFFFHMVHGKGEIKSIKNMAKEKMANVHFESGSKMLILGTSGYFRKINA